jgi:hypothetical protein
MPHRNVAVELLRKLLASETKAQSKKNVVQARSFAEMLKRTALAYQNRAIATYDVIESHRRRVGDERPQECHPRLDDPRIEPANIRKKGKMPKNGSLFFTIFQTFMTGLIKDGNPWPYFGEYPRDFFDLSIIDERHRFVVWGRSLSCSTRTRNTWASWKRNCRRRYRVLTVNGRMRLCRLRWHSAEEGSQTWTDQLLDEAKRAISEGVWEMACRLNRGATSFQQTADNLARGSASRCCVHRGLVERRRA